MLKLCLLVLCTIGAIHSLDNGLALTPPMGWMNWQRYRCVTDCVNYPDECVSEQLFKRMADKMVSDGYLAAGYEYIIVDDCWSAMERDEEQRLVADPERFPSGMKALADYVHGLGLKFGLYGDFGTHTCAGYPGSIDHLELDAETFASWDVDYVKLDGCYADPDIMEAGYAEYSGYLNATGRPMIFSCSWPAYQEPLGQHSNYEALKQHCNLWRNFDDIMDSWASVNYITAWFVDNQRRIMPHSGPGHWNDPDMLIIGDFGLSYEQSKAQMTMWCIMAAPLIMSNDLTNIRPEFKEILLNKEALAINQDVLGIAGYMMLKKKDIEAWVRPISPLNDDNQLSYAVGFVSYRDDGIRYPIEFTFEELELPNSNGYDTLDIFTGETGTVQNSIKVQVAPSGAVFLKLTPRSQ